MSGGKMSQSKGTLYFIGESNLFSGEQSVYTKIGFLKDEREVKDREKGHGIGITRRLESVENIQSPSVQTLETCMHNSLVKFRVGSGEWLQLDNQHLANQIIRAKDLAKEYWRGKYLKNWGS